MIRFSIILFFLSFSLYSKNKEHIAVLPFSSQGIEKKELIIIADSLRKELSKSAKYDVMERLVLEKRLKSEGINNLYTCDDLACALVFGEFLSLKYVIQGRLSKIENTYTFSIRFIDTENEAIIDDFTEFFTGDIENLLKKIVPKLSKKILRIRIRQWKVEKKTVELIDEAQVKEKKQKAEELKLSSLSTLTTLAPEIKVEKDIPESELSVSPNEEPIDKKEEIRNRMQHKEVVGKPVAEDLRILKSSVSTSTTLVPEIEVENDMPESELSVSPKEESADKKEEARNRRQLEEVVGKPVAEDLRILKSSVSTSTTLVPEVEVENDIPDSELSVSPQEESIDEKEGLRNRRPNKEVVGKSGAEESRILVSSASTSTTLASSIEFQKEDKAEVDSVQKQIDKVDEVEKKEGMAFTTETVSDIPYIKSIGEMENELASEDNKKIDQKTPGIEENSVKKDKRSRRLSRRRDRKRDRNDTASVPSSIDPKLIQKDSEDINNVYRDSERDTSSDVESASPVLVEDSEIESDKLAQSKEEKSMPDDADKTLVTDVENEELVNINELQEDGSKKKQNAIIISSGISAAVAIPVFLMLFSKKDKKESSSISLTVEWP